MENQTPFSEIDKEIICYVQNGWKYYSTGYSNRSLLICRDNDYIQYTKDDKNCILKIHCNSLDKTMQITKLGDKECIMDENDEIPLIKFDIIDIDSQGWRWEGNTLQSQPYGYGNYFDSDNQLIYRGFIYNKMKVCYGCEIFPKSGFVEYCGGFLLNKKTEGETENTINNCFLSLSHEFLVPAPSSEGAKSTTNLTER